MCGEEPVPQMTPVESPHVVSFVKLHILKKGEYTLWSIRMEHYLTNTDYALWQVIMNGDEPVQTTKDENGVETEVPPKTAQALLQRQRERKAKSILLLAIPDEYQQVFPRYKGMQKLPWAAIKSNLWSQGTTPEDCTSGQPLMQCCSGQCFEESLEFVEAQLVVHQKNEVMCEEKIAVLEFEVKDKDKTGLGYGDQLNEKNSSDSGLFNSVFDSRSSDGDDNQTNDRFKKDNEYHAVPPPLTGNYIPPLADLSFAGLDDSVYRPTTNKTSASVSQVETSNTPPSNTSVEMPRVESVRPSGVIIEDWVSDDEEDIFQSEDSQTTVKPSFKKIEFTKARNETVKSDKQAVKPRMVTQSPKVDRKDWNGKMTQKLGLGFGFTKKACFVCGSHNHLIKDCDFHEKRMSKESVLRKGTGHKEVRPIWNNTQRINHQNKFVPTAVLTRSGRIPVSTAKQYVNTATPKNRVNVSKSKINTFPKSHSPIRRPFYKSTVLNTRVSKVKVNTVKVNGVNTAGQTAVSTVKGNGVTAVKASAGCVWRPKKTDLNNGSKDNSGSWISKRGNPQQALKYKGMFDSGCSRHMTGNKALLTDYQDIDGGFVAFGGSTRGGKITGIGKIRTNKIDFEDVFFVKELKFNLFSVSQMCDKKNSILFTETECLVLSPDFKLIDEVKYCLESQAKQYVQLRNGMSCFVS
ncbi:hypothetical protein Tco_1318737 [Tanacetum coccineum]